MAEQTVVVVEDEENLLAALQYNLERDGYRVCTAIDGAKGLELIRENAPNVVILDVMLPGLNGFDMCRILRRETDVPILMLTAKGEEVDRVVGLELGADDYVTKPFSMRELLARVRALLRRPRLVKSGASPEAPHEVLRAGDLEIDLSAHTVNLRGAPVVLKPREFDLLALLVSNKGRAMTRDAVLERIWGHDYIGDTRTVDVHIRWLREKVEATPSAPKRIITIRGVGYRFLG
ncbi:MAG: response regulator transcription factor [Dehalococcoidia bacterium]|nr:response regulator transcription factor [Dehalococcoidia bacterium]